MPADNDEARQLAAATDELTRGGANPAAHAKRERRRDRLNFILGIGAFVALIAVALGTTSAWAFERHRNAVVGDALIAATQECEQSHGCDAEAIPAPEDIGVEPGPRGTPGQDGQDGRDGRDGQDGQDGEDGTDGEDGADGVGTPGQNGNDGADGVGIPGQPGANGTDGTDGRDGRGIATLMCGDDNGRWTVTYDDGTSADAGVCRIDPAPEPDPAPNDPAYILP